MLRDYVAGRSSEMDVILDWVESRTEEITEADVTESGGSAPMIDIAGQGSLKEVSRQLWAMLNPLLVNNDTVKVMFANVPRHNGLEAWRRIYEPINEDNILIRKDLLPLITNPKAASSIDAIPLALENWDTNQRLYKAAGGDDISEQQKRLTFIQMLPRDVCAYVTMHIELPEYHKFADLKRFALKYVKVISSLNRTAKHGVHAVMDRANGHAGQHDQGEGQRDDDWPDEE